MRTPLSARRIPDRPVRGQQQPVQGVRRRRRLHRSQVLGARFVGTDGRALTFEAAMARFIDRTGRPGPATWEAGTFPAGQGDMPVSGVSWYEAAAFAKFAGKSLPTIYHWARAASVGNARYVVPLSNLEGNGPLPTGTPRGISIGGVSDMAGNVREWCVNDAGRGQRFILGGGWSDAKYAFVDAYAQPPMDRSVINGIRLAMYDAADTSVALASRPIPRAFTDYTRERPVSDAVFAGFLPQFDYDPIAARRQGRSPRLDVRRLDRGEGQLHRRVWW